jgi:hypothetical protein
MMRMRVLRERERGRGRDCGQRGEEVAACGYGGFSRSIGLVECLHLTFGFSLLNTSDETMKIMFCCFSVVFLDIPKVDIHALHRNHHKWYGINCNLYQET